MFGAAPLISGLLLLAAVACGGGGDGAAPRSSASTSAGGAAVNTCSEAHQSRHVGYLVVEHLSGQTIQRCAGFDGETIDGNVLMRATGIQFVLAADSSASPPPAPRPL